MRTKISETKPYKPDKTGQKADKKADIKKDREADYETAKTDGSSSTGDSTWRSIHNDGPGPMGRAARRRVRGKVVSPGGGRPGNGREGVSKTIET